MNSFLAMSEIIFFSKSNIVNGIPNCSCRDPKDLYIDEDRLYAVAVFEDDELAIAIGRNGHNIKLASKVTGYTIDAVKKTDYELENKISINLNKISGISKIQLSSLNKNKIKTSTDFLESEKDILLGIKGIGEKTIEKIKLLINNHIEKTDSKNKEKDD